MEEAQRVTQIRQQLDLLQQTTNVLVTRSELLLDRFGSVTRSTKPQIEKEPATKPEELVPLADEIRASRYRVESVTKRINDTLDRLEL